MQHHDESVRLQHVYGNYAESGYYESKWSLENPGNQAIEAERTHVLKRQLVQHGYFPLHDASILDVGCGTGRMLAQLRAWGARSSRLFGIDLLENRIAAARAAHPEIRFQHANAEELPFAKACFDLVVLSTVFTSILDPEIAKRVAGEVQRVVRPGGAIVWYDFRYNSPSNRNVKGLDRNAVQHLFPTCSLHLRSITLLPPIARRLGRWTSVLYPLLAAIPFLRSHYLGLLIKPESSEDEGAACVSAS